MISYRGSAAQGEGTQGKRESRSLIENKLNIMALGKECLFHILGDSLITLPANQRSKKTGSHIQGLVMCLYHLLIVVRSRVLPGSLQLSVNPGSLQLSLDLPLLYCLGVNSLEGQFDLHCFSACKKYICLLRSEQTLACQGARF